MIVEVYSKNNCIFCTRAKDLLSRKNIPYTEYNIDMNYTREEFLQKFPNAKTVPQIVINGEHIPGYDHLTEWMENYDKSRFLQD
jgi:glutaredoxin 3